MRDVLHQHGLAALGTCNQQARSLCRSAMMSIRRPVMFSSPFMSRSSLSARPGTAGQVLEQDPVLGRLRRLHVDLVDLTSAK